MRAARQKTVTAVLVVGASVLTLLTDVSGAGAKTAEAAAPAAAASAPAGYSIASSGFIHALNGYQTHGQVACPSGTKPVGGGVTVDAENVLAGVNSSYPIASSWAADVNNTSGADTLMNVFAVCAKRPKLTFKVVTASFSVAANSQASGRAICPRGVVVGGGTRSDSASTAINVNSSFPDTTKSWRVDMDNATPTASTFAVFAICRVTAPAGYSRKIGSPVGNPAESQTPLAISCTGSSVPLSGGVLSTSSSTAVDVNTSTPNGSGWLVYENNGSTLDSSATGYVICAGS